MADFIELEDGTGHIRLEDDSGAILLEDTPPPEVIRQSQLGTEVFASGEGLRNSQLATEVFATGEGLRVSQLGLEIWVRDGVTPPPDPGTDRWLRRLRDFLYPSSPNNYTVTIPETEILCQTGVGVSDPDDQGYDPQLMFSVSKDGGKTFGAEQWAAMGKQGNYTKRVKFSRTPNQYRNAVGRVVVTDPVDVALVDCVVPEIKEGSS